MAEATQFFYTYTELVTLMLKERGIHEGYWAPLLNFGLRATNVPGPEGNVLPTAIVAILQVGLQRSEKPTQQTVDAAQANPKPRAVKKKGKR